MKTLIEETYSANQATPVIILTHSMGSPMMLYFLLQQSPAWKSRHIRALVTLSGPWGGTVRALKVFAPVSSTPAPGWPDLPLKVGDRKTPFPLTLSSPQLFLPPRVPPIHLCRPDRFLRCS